MNVNTMEYDNVLLCLRMASCRKSLGVFIPTFLNCILQQKYYKSNKERGDGRRRKKKIKKQLQSIECERELTEEKVPVWWGSQRQYAGSGNAGVGVVPKVYACIDTRTRAQIGKRKRIRGSKKEDRQQTRGVVEEHEEPSCQRQCREKWSVGGSSSLSSGQETCGQIRFVGNVLRSFFFFLIFVKVSREPNKIV